MKIFKNGTKGTSCLFAISCEPDTIRKLKSTNNRLERKYKFKFGDSFIARVAIEELLTRPDVETFLTDKKMKMIIKRSE